MIFLHVRKVSYVYEGRKSLRIRSQGRGSISIGFMCCDYGRIETTLPRKGIIRENIEKKRGKKKTGKILKRKKYKTNLIIASIYRSLNKR